MNDRQAKIGQELKEVEMKGLIHKGMGQTHGPTIDTQVSIRVATRRDAEGLRGMFSRFSHRKALYGPVKAPEIVRVPRRGVVGARFFVLWNQGRGLTTLNIMNCKALTAYARSPRTPLWKTRTSSARFWPAQIDFIPYPYTTCGTKAVTPRKACPAQIRKAVAPRTSAQPRGGAVW
jgi:hypothetical protein